MGKATGRTNDMTHAGTPPVPQVSKAQSLSIEMKWFATPKYRCLLSCIGAPLANAHTIPRGNKARCEVELLCIMIELTFARGSTCMQAGHTTDDRDNAVITGHNKCQASTLHGIKRIVDTIIDAIT